MFQLTGEEVRSLRSQFATSKQGRGGRRYAPLVFTEQGIAMLSSVLNSERAIQVNIEIMRAFVRLREMIATHKDLARKLAALEKRYDAQFKVVFDAIRELMAPPEPNKRKIGFLVKERVARYGKTLNCHFDVSGITKDVINNRVRVSCSFFGRNRNEKRRGPGCIQAGASVSAQNLLDD